MIAIKTHPDPPAATEDFPAINRRMTDLLEGIRKRQVALNLARCPDDAADEHRSAWAKHFAADFIERANRRPDKLEAEIRDLQDEVENLRPFHVAARERHEQVLAQQATAIARELQPQQRVLCRKISVALTQLSGLLSEASELHREFERRSPRPSSPYWADTAGELIPFAALDDYQSAGARWAQRMRLLGILPR